MRFEILQIRNALGSESNELELGPNVQKYLISSSQWRKWSKAVRDRALQDFLSGQPSFQREYDVSEDGNSFFPKKFSRITLKPGSYSRHRAQPSSTQIKRSLSLSAAEIICSDEYTFLILLINLLPGP